MGDKFTIIVDVEEVDGRYYFDLKQPESQRGGLTLEGMRAILSGALALTIRGDKNEAKAMTEVIDYLNSEFINPDSFSDVLIDEDK